MTNHVLTLVTALGWVGALAGLLAYAQVSKGRWSADSFAFQCVNIGGATLMFLVAAANGVWPSAAANIAWILIGTQTLVVMSRARRASRRADGDQRRRPRRAGSAPQQATVPVLAEPVRQLLR